VKKSFIKTMRNVRELRLETGFSMLEAVVVVGVLLALAVGGFVAYGTVTENAKKAMVRSAASQLHTGVVTASFDGDATTKPDDVITQWNASTDKIIGEIISPKAGETSANGDFCVQATNKENPSITARSGACDGLPASPGGGSSNPGQDTDGDGIPNSSDPDIDGDGIPNADDSTPNGGTPPSSLPKTATDLDGDGIPNLFDTTPRGESGQHLAGFGGNWSGELGTTVDTTATTGYIIQGPLAGQRIGLLSRNTGSYHACGTLESNGNLYCWGYNGDGQLGRVTSTYEDATPGLVDGLAGKTINQVVANAYSTCALADGAPYCWGNINYSYSPVAVDTSGVLAGKTITKLVGGNQFACVLADGAPYCWGHNGGRPILGNGTTGGSDVPVAVDTTGVLAGKTITDLFSGNSQACVSVSSGGAYCWGDNVDAQIGNGTRVDALVPAAVVGLTGTVTDMAGGYSNMCAVADGKAYCWGGNTYTWNLVGDGTYHDYAYDPVTYKSLDSNYTMTPVPVYASGVLAGKTVSRVDLGDDHACVLADGAPYCWGEGDFGEGYVGTLTPVAVGGAYTAGNKTVGIWTLGGSTIFSYFD
jgi:alpha-tubulin suppressor-like RCC1 family protein